MNHLAHFLLADGSPESLVGNFLGDFVKGRPEGRYPPAVVRGIRLHRRLDHFTDHHAASHRAVRRLPSADRRWARIALDMALDHRLARIWRTRDEAGFTAFRQHVYGMLRAHKGIMPTPAYSVMVRMAADDWLAAYADWAHIELALQAMGRRLSRANRLGSMGPALRAVQTDIEADLDEFWHAAERYAVEENRRLAWGDR